MCQQRLNQFKKIIKQNNFDAFLVSNFYNILYLSNFKTLTENEREAWFLITNKNAYLFSDSRYLDNKVNFRTDAFSTKLISPEKGLLEYLKEIFEKEKIKNCALEGDNLKISEFNFLKKNLPKINFINTEKLLIKIREIKDVEEIKKIKKACEISDKCLSEIIKNIKVGQTEKEIAFKIEFWLKEKGYDLAFYPITAIDENSATIHYDTREGNNKKIKKNSLILIDFGAKYQNYLSDMTRIIFIGKPTNEQINVYHKLLNAQKKTIAYANQSGKQDRENKIKNIDIYCRQLLTKSYLLPNYPHSTGHGVGLEIHEYPKISPVSEDKLLKNQVITIEPGVYFQGKWGMRIEDTVLINKNQVEILTRFDKKPLIISN